MDKKNKNPNVPNLRFREFNEQLVYTSFGHVMKLYRGSSPRPIINYVTTDKSGLNWIKIGDMPSTGNRVFFCKERINKEGSKKSRAVYKGDIILSNSMSFGKPYILEIDGFIHDGWFVIRDYQNYIDKTYLCQLLSSDVVQKQYKSTAAGGVVKNISSDLVNSVKFHLPSIMEQRKIARFLELIDQKIEVQIKIIDDYMTYRNAIVDYFFESLSSDWNRIKLSNILKEYSELHVKDNSIVHATLSKEGIFPKTDRYDRDFLVKDEDKKYKVTHLNDICYNPANLKFGVITRNTIGDCIISPIYVTFKIENGFLPKFVELLVTRKRFISRARKYEQGTVYERMAVNSSDLLSMYVSIPSLNTQQTIVNIINNIDNKISNEKELLKLYRAQKVYLLKNMFI